MRQEKRRSIFFMSDFFGQYFNTLLRMGNEIHKTETPHGSHTRMLIVNVLFESGG